MVNNKGGKKYKRTKKVSYSTKFPTKIESFEDYGYVLSMNGGQHCTLLLSDGLEYTGVIRGSLKKKHIFIKNDCYVIVQRRDFQDNKVDISFQYGAEQVDELAKTDETFKSLKTIIDRKNNARYSHVQDSEDEEIIEESDEEQEENFYEMMNRLNKDKKEINVDDI